MELELKHITPYLPYGLQVEYRGEVHTAIPQPKDRNIFLRDILEDEVDKKYYLNSTAIKSIVNHKERNAKNKNGSE